MKRFSVNESNLLIECISRVISENNDSDIYISSRNCFKIGVQVIDISQVLDKKNVLDFIQKSLRPSDFSYLLSCSELNNRKYIVIVYTFSDISGLLYISQKIFYMIVSKFGFSTTLLSSYCLLSSDFYSGGLRKVCLNIVNGLSSISNEERSCINNYTVEEGDKISFY